MKFKNMLYFLLEIHMENQINGGDQNAQQIGQNPISQSTQIPEKPKFNYWMVSTLILTVLLLGVLGWYIFSVIYQTSQAGSSILPIQPPLSNKFACSQNSDCIIGIQATPCCSCPEAINKNLIGTKDWEVYEFGKDYSSQRTRSCGGTVACKPCELPETPICSNGQCQFPGQTNAQTSDNQKQKTGIMIQLEKTIYRAGEPVAFTITNKTQNNIYYFPETCATSLVQVFSIQDGNSTLIVGDPKMCLLAPSVQTLLPNKNISSKIPDKVFSKMTPGTYKIKFYYSLEIRDRFGIGEQSIIESETITIAK
jgi:hypothetical protein